MFMAIATAYDAAGRALFVTIGCGKSPAAARYAARTGACQRAEAHRVAPMVAQLHVEEC